MKPTTKTVRMRQMPRMIIVSLLLCFPNNNIKFVSPQQQPNPLFSTEQFNTSAFFRQSVCDQQDKFYNRTVLLEHALEGIELRTVMIPSQYFRLDPTTNAINTKYPGLLAVLLDEISKRGKFTWRNSYAVTLESPKDNYTWTELLTWSADTYDLTADWWATSLERMKLGISYPESWYDASIIMVGDTSSKEESSFTMWSFLQPFTNAVWGLIIVTVIISGIVYWIMESIDKNSDKRRLEKNVYENVFLAGVTMTGHFEFHPRTNAARLFTWSLTFWALIVAAAYTANLASFLVVKNEPRLKVETVEEAVQKAIPMCVTRSTQADNAVSSKYPMYNRFIRKDTAKEMFIGLQNGECRIIITTVSSWNYWQRDNEANPNCRLNWIGRTFQFVPAGFATVSDSGSLCTSLIRDVVNIHLVQMKEEGFIDDAWDEHLRQTSTQTCSASGQDDDEESSGGDDSGELDLKSMGGIFIFHYMLSFTAIAIALIYKYFGWDQTPRFAKTGPMSRKAIREKLNQMSMSFHGKDKGSTTPNDEREKRMSLLLKEAEKKTFSEVVYRPRKGGIERSTASRKLNCNVDDGSGHSAGSDKGKDDYDENNTYPEQRTVDTSGRNMNMNGGEVAMQINENDDEKELSLKELIRPNAAASSSNNKEQERLIDDLFNESFSRGEGITSGWEVANDQYEPTTEMLKEVVGGDSHHHPDSKKPKSAANDNNHNDQDQNILRRRRRRRRRNRGRSATRERTMSRKERRKRNHRQSSLNTNASSYNSSSAPSDYDDDFDSFYSEGVSDTDDMYGDYVERKPIYDPSSSNTSTAVISNRQNNNDPKIKKTLQSMQNQISTIMSILQKQQNSNNNESTSNHTTTSPQNE